MSKNLEEIPPICNEHSKGEDKILWNTARLPRDYRMRWGMETGYVGVEKFRAKTTSRNHALRLLYFYYALMLYNAWLLANLIIARRFSRHLLAPMITIQLVKAALHQMILQSFDT